MDLNGDGVFDLLSGSYSRHDRDMAGLFQVLQGRKDGTFAKASVMNGGDGAPLILPRTEQMTDRICTRAFAADLDGDGKLDLVSGNFSGTFAFFRGEGNGTFAPTSAWLEAEGTPLQVDMHSDPFLVDWDRDGDLDLLSGSARGGVFLFPNAGSKTAPKWGARVTLLAAPEGPSGAPDDEVRFGDAHLKGPGDATRVWADDVDGDGKLDLLVGDQVTLLHVAKGVDEKEARSKFAAWSRKQQEFFQQPPGESEEAQKKWQETYEALEKERETFARQESTGFVWLLRQK